MASITRKHADRTEADIDLEVITAPTYTGGTGVIRLNGGWYAVRCHGHTSREGYRFIAMKGNKVYDVDTSTGQGVCDCMDCEVRQRKCKHVAALEAMRRQGAI